MSKRIKLPVGRRGGGEVGAHRKVVERDQAARAEFHSRDAPRRAANDGLRRQARLTPASKEDHQREERHHSTLYDDRFGHPHYTTGFVPGYGDDFNRGRPACGAVEVEHVIEARWNTSVYNHSLYIAKVTCAKCKVLIDWGLESGLLTVNRFGEAFDTDPLEPSRRALRKTWNRMCAAAALDSVQ